MMDKLIEQKIRERAYHIWKEAGCMHGLELEHWAAAERDVVVTRASATRKPAAGASATKPVVAKAIKAKTKVVATKPVAKKAKTAKSDKGDLDGAKSPRRTNAPTVEMRGILN